MTDNQREYLRFPVALSAEVLFEGQIHPAATRDISEGGVGFITQAPLSEGSTVSVLLFLTQDGIEDPDLEPLDVEGTIVWSAEREDGGHIAGARFSDLNSAQQARLARFLMEVERATEKVA
ncbi:MAG: PilZ domain-containing protein [Myxococcales bacterium]|nr:PilZ domain-containing protein [Myxococcales bacterium]